MIKSKKLSKIKIIKHGFFNKTGGKSKKIYKSLNCGPGSKDNPSDVKKNLQIVKKKIKSTAKSIFLLHQIHSNKFVYINKKSIFKSFVALLLFFLITIPVNLLLDANYFWICGKPPVGTVLDYFGPWPWYLIVATLLALIHFYFFYYLINFISSKISK